MEKGNPSSPFIFNSIGVTLSWSPVSLELTCTDESTNWLMREWVCRVLNAMLRPCHFCSYLVKVSIALYWLLNIWLRLMLSLTSSIRKTKGLSTISSLLRGSPCAGSLMGSTSRTGWDLASTSSLWPWDWIGLPVRKPHLVGPRCGPFYFVSYVSHMLLTP